MELTFKNSEDIIQPGVRNEDKSDLSFDVYDYHHPIRCFLFLPNHKIAFGGNMIKSLGNIRSELIIYKIDGLRLKLYKKHLNVEAEDPIISMLTLKNYPDYLICGCFYGSIYIYDIHSGSTIQIKGKDEDEDNIKSLVELNDSKFASSGREIIIWNYKTKQSEFTISNSMTDGSPYFYKNKLIYAISNLIIEFSDLDSTNPNVSVKKIFKFKSEISCQNFAFNSISNHFYTGLDNGEVIEFSIRCSRIIRKFTIKSKKNSRVLNLILSKSNHFLFVCYGESIHIWNLLTKICVHSISPFDRSSQEFSYLGMMYFSNIFISCTFSGMIKTYLFYDNTMERVPFQNKIFKNKEYVNLYIKTF